MRSTRRAWRLTIYVAAPHRHDQRHAVGRFLESAATLGIAGGSVFAGFCGFGRGHHLHEAHFLHGPDETPLTIIVIDDRDAITDLLRAQTRLLPGAVAVVDEVTEIRYRRDHPVGKHRRWLR